MTFPSQEQIALWERQLQIERYAYVCITQFQGKRKASIDQAASELVDAFALAPNDAADIARRIAQRISNKKCYQLHHEETYSRRQVSAQNSRSARLGVEGVLTADEWEAVCKAHHDKCAKCNAAKPLTIDHIRPLSKGGLNVIGNVQPLCADCNMAKGATWDENT